MKYLILGIFCACTFATFGATTPDNNVGLVLENTLKTDVKIGLVTDYNHVARNIDIANVIFSIDGEVIDGDFATASCSTKIDGVTYYADNVGCFLCSQQGAEERCQRVLNRRIANVFALF
jgi:hypothetical protein